MSTRITTSQAKKLGLKKKNSNHTESGRFKINSQNEDHIIKFEFSDKAVPKHRPRTFIDETTLSKAFHNAKNFRQFMGMIKTRTITTKETRDFEKSIALQAKLQMKGLKPYQNPIELQITFVFDGDEKSIPTAHKDGDLDNLEKSLCDALNGILYEDDRLIAAKHSVKICRPKEQKIIVRALPFNCQNLDSHP